MECLVYDDFISFLRNPLSEKKDENSFQNRLEIAQRLYILSFIYLGIVSLSSNIIDQFKVAFFYIGILGLWFGQTNANEGTVSSNREQKILAQEGTVGTEIFSYRMCRVYWEYFN